MVDAKTAEQHQKGIELACIDTIANAAGCTEDEANQWPDAWLECADGSAAQKRGKVVNAGSVNVAAAPK